MNLGGAYKRLKNGETYTNIAKDLGTNGQKLKRHLIKAGFNIENKHKGKDEVICSNCSTRFTKYVSKKSKTGKEFCCRDCLYTYSRNNKMFNGARFHSGG